MRNYHLQYPGAIRVKHWSEIGDDACAPYNVRFLVSERLCFRRDHKGAIPRNSLEVLLKGRLCVVPSCNLVIIQDSRFAGVHSLVKFIEHIEHRLLCRFSEHSHVRQEVKDDTCLTMLHPALG